MIDIFESTARTNPDQVFFTFVDASGQETAYTYRQARLIAATLALYLQSHGVAKNDLVLVDLPNSPEFVFFLLAAGYGSFTAVCPSQETPDSEKLIHSLDLKRNGHHIVCTISPDEAHDLMEYIQSLFVEGADSVEGLVALLDAQSSIAKPRMIARSSSSSRGFSRISGDFFSDSEANANAFARSKLNARPSVSAERNSARNSSPLQTDSDSAGDTGSSRRRSSAALVRNSASVQRLGKRTSAPLSRTSGSLDRESVNSDPLNTSGPITRKSRPILGEERDALEEAVHFAEREAHLFDQDSCAVVLFSTTSPGKAGVSAKYKAIPLTWRQLTEAAAATNQALMYPGRGLWQAVLPFSHASGLAILFRSVQNRSPLRIYEQFDVNRVLGDAESRRATHIALTDDMMQEVLEAERIHIKDTLARAHTSVKQAVKAGIFSSQQAVDEAAAHAEADALASRRDTLYQAVLLVGGAPNPESVEEALRKGVNVLATYGTAETSAQVAFTPITRNFTGGLELLEGYSARIVDADEQGFGRLAIHGPGVFDGYLNARAPFAVDGYFLTGDTAALHNGCIYVKDCPNDTFISEGRTVYPTEIANVLRQIPGISDAHVFAVPDPEHGAAARRPAAVVERANATITPDDVYHYLAQSLPHLKAPQSIAVVDQLPRRMGAIDRERTEEMYASRLELKRVVLHFMRIPLRSSISTSNNSITHREVVVVEAVDHLGNVGLGECASATSVWTDAYTLSTNVQYLQDELVPAMIGRSIMHPREASDLFARMPESNRYPLATGALESALWDLFGQIHKRPLWSLLNEEYERLKKINRASNRIGNLSRAASLSNIQAVVTTAYDINSDNAHNTAGLKAALDQAIDAGYKRVKVPISPDDDPQEICELVKDCDGVSITLDGMRSFGLTDFKPLKQYRDADVEWIEDPIDPNNPIPGHGDIIAQSAWLQRNFSTPIGLNETVGDIACTRRAFKFHDLRYLGINVGKLGSVEATLEFIIEAQTHGRHVWIDATYATGLGKRLHAAFETLPGITIPGDLDTPARAYTIDITQPPYLVRKGCVPLNVSGYSTGNGCVLNPQALSQTLVKRISIE